METKKFNVEELSFADQAAVNGGFLLLLLDVIAVMGAVVYIYENAGPSLIKGFKEGYRSTQYQSEIPND